MTADEVLASHRAMLAEIGEDIIIRRYYGPAGPNRPKYEAKVRARVTGLGNPELIGAVAQGRYKVIGVIDPDAPVPTGKVALASLLPLELTDKMVIRGKEMDIEALDQFTRLGAGFDAQVKG